MDLEAVEPDPLVGTKVADKYRVLARLGAGGMGAVYRVVHEHTGKTLALKLLHPEYAARADLVERFLNEAKAASLIDNDHIVETTDAGRLANGAPYLTMEYLEGAPISELIQTRQRLQFHEAIDLVVQAADGIEAAHQAQIVHRDIKPENLVLQKGKRQFVKILDFGIARFGGAEASNHRLTRADAMLGTLYYMSPEQVMSPREVDHRTDIYSLGVVLYECVTGRVPFDAETQQGLGVAICAGHYVPVSELRPDVPAGFDEILARAMHRDREQRYKTMRAFAALLRNLGTRSPHSAEGAELDERRLSRQPEAFAVTTSSVPPEAEPETVKPLSYSADVASPSSATRSVNTSAELTFSSALPSPAESAPLSTSALTDTAVSAGVMPRTANHLRGTADGVAVSSPTEGQRARRGFGLGLAVAGASALLWYGLAREKPGAEASMPAAGHDVSASTESPLVLGVELSAVPGASDSAQGRLSTEPTALATGGGALTSPQRIAPRPALSKGVPVSNKPVPTNTASTAPLHSSEDGLARDNPFDQ